MDAALLTAKQNGQRTGSTRIKPNERTDAAVTTVLTVAGAIPARVRSSHPTNNMSTITKKHTFGEATAAAQDGKRISFDAWPPDQFVFRQVPSTVPAAIIPKMSSLPDAVKAYFVREGGPIHYANQWAKASGSFIQGWSPSPEETLEAAWAIHHDDPQEFKTAPVAETAGTATPLG